MSDTTTNTTGACELVLDYVYGELDEARKRTFEEHLPTCARCQQEVASFGRVRTAARRVLPAVEPSPSVGGALHAQLMHAAAQRKPRRGILLSFPRKIVEHPALSAAAMFVIVGGAIAINWSHGKLAMPAAEHAETDAPKPTEAPLAPKAPEVAAAAPAAEPMPAAKEKEGGKAESVVYKGAAGDNRPAEDKTQLALQTPSGTLTVERPAAHRAVGAAPAAPSPAKKAAAAPARMKNIVVDGKIAKRDAIDPLAGGDVAGSKDEAAANGLGSVSVGGAAGSTGGGRASMDDANAKSSAPAQLAQKSAEDKPAAAKASHGYAVAPTSTPPKPMPTSATSDQTWRNTEPSAPPPPAASMPTSTPQAQRSDGYFARSQAQGAPAVQKPASTTRGYVQLHKQADELAKSNRCDEAIKLYQELEKSGQYISPTERVSWVRCLTQRGRQEEAQQRLDELKQEKRVTNQQIQDAERELNDSRRRVETKKAQKAPAPADRAPATETVEQRRAEPPAQASPPDSTNTKVKASSPAY